LDFCGFNINLGVHNSSLDGSHIQTETSEEPDQGQGKEIKIGMYYSSLLSYVSTLEIWPNVINITVLIIFGLGRKQALQRARKEVDQKTRILGTECHIFFSDRQFFNSVTVLYLIHIKCT
jgi:hypothetical protein